MKTRRLKSKALVAMWLLAALALATARLHGAVEIYVTDYLAAQDKSIKPLGGIRTNVARLFATPGEYEPVSLAVRPDERVGQLFLAVTDLSGPGGVIPKSQVRVQSVEGFHGGDKDILMDLGQAWDMPAFQRELFWATVHVPAETKPGEYTGEVTVTGGGRPVARLMLQLEVLPFRLEQPPLALGYNYSSPKDPRALAAHLEDMRAHGLTTVAPLYGFHLPVQDEDTTEFGEFLEAFRCAGFRQPVYFGTSMNLLMSELAGYGPVDSRRFQRKFLQVMRRLHAEAQRHGVPVVFSIADELTNQALPGVRKGELLARLCWEELPEMAVTADMNGWLEVTTMAPFLNVATFNNGWDGIDHHNQGRRLINRDFLLERQQKTDAIPWFVNAGSDRFPFGFFFWKMAQCGVCGKVEWYYNLGPNERGSIVRTDGARIWPTLAYERSREGIDDLRYLVTLERRIAAAKSSGLEPAAVSRAEALLQRIADGIVDNWTAYTDGGETFPGDGFELMSADKSAGLTDYQRVRRALADAIMELPPLRLVPKPTDSAVERRPRPQPTVPDAAKEVPFDETAPEPVLTGLERERGYLLFQRPLTECVFPNTRPLPHERIEALVAFATPGEFEPVTLALYPVRPLQNLKVRVSSLRFASREIPAERIDVRLATYWNVGYPAYTTLKTYRRVPELLERVTVHTSPAGECQWYWLTVHVPDDAKPGLYRGTATVWDDGFGETVEIPLALRVLGFSLEKDPRKHFSAYFYVRNKALYKGRDEAFIRRAADKDYRAMVDFGLDMLPTLYLRCDDGQRIVLAEGEELERMLAVGLKGPAPVTADSVIARIYRDTTPGGKHENHWRVNPLPPPAFYERLTALFRAFEVERRAKGWPEFICCPIDEVDASCKEFGAGVYAAVKAAGLRTYATKDPIGADAADYAPHLDVWCSQPYSVPYERIVSQNRFEYWCYPNHNAGEIKDRRTMCKGGRTTYGFGLWRSGYTTLIPWHWCWPSEPDPFDYLRGRFSGCGQRVDDEGEVIPAIYWACFREGYDDARYLYTLQQAIVQREGSKDSACRATLDEGRRLLQETWDAIRVQPRYLAEGMWPSEEFDAIRWRLAVQTERLLEHPVTGMATAPSALIAASARAKPAAQPPSPYETAARGGSLESFDLGAGFAGWRNGTAEGKTDIAEAARHAGKVGLRWTVEIDHKSDGGEGGKYPVGWPRLAREFKPGELDTRQYDTLEFWVRIDSNRDEVADDHTPIGLVISSHGKQTTLYSTTADLGGEQRAWVPLRFPMKQMMLAADAGTEPWKSVSRVQLYLSEHDYAHGTRLICDVGEVSLLRLPAPVVVGMDAPRHVLLPRRMLAFAFDLIGTGAIAKGSHTVAAALEEAGGAVRTETLQDLTEPRQMALGLPALEPGGYTLRLTIRDAAGRTCSELAQPITAHAGPLY